MFNCQIIQNQIVTKLQFLDYKKLLKIFKIYVYKKIYKNRIFTYSNYS